MSAFDESTAPVTDASQPAPGGAASPSEGMARLLEIAAKNADELLTEARAEAEQMTSSAQAEADKIVGEARIEAERVRAETEDARNKATGEIARLRQTEQEHRDRMKSHLQEMLAKVEANSVG
jgi:cell division septum initiation protein DivIVA